MNVKIRHENSSTYIIELVHSIFYREPQSANNPQNTQSMLENFQFGINYTIMFIRKMLLIYYTDQSMYVWVDPLNGIFNNVLTQPTCIMYTEEITKEGLILNCLLCITNIVIISPVLGLYRHHVSYPGPESAR